MQFLFLLYHDENVKMTAEQGAQARERQWAIIDETTRKGILRGCAPLQPTSATVSMRAQGGSVVAMDGPFTETKEALGGFYLLDCADGEEARMWGGRLAQTGCAAAVEVRPLAAIPGRVESEEPAAAAVHA
jgi:hypothetical protein